MKNLRVTWKGVTPLIMHSCKCVNPLHPIAIELRNYTIKRVKTDEDLKIISDLEWEAGAYLDKNDELYIPAENIEATIKNGAKAYKLGKAVEKFVTVTDLYIPFDYGEHLTKKELIENYEYRDTRVMNVQRNKVLRTRPRFDKWSITFNLMYDESGLNLEDITKILEYSGKYVGLCDSRPKYGKFAVIIEELD